MGQYRSKQLAAECETCTRIICCKGFTWAEIFFNYWKYLILLTRTPNLHRQPYKIHTICAWTVTDLGAVMIYDIPLKFILNWKSCSYLTSDSVFVWNRFEIFHKAQQHRCHAAFGNYLGWISCITSSQIGLIHIDSAYRFSANFVIWILYVFYVMLHDKNLYFIWSPGKKNI